MKKLLVIVLGLFVFTACDDGGGSAGNGNVETPITEKLTTSLVEISMISSNDLGTVLIGSQHDVKFTVTNLSTTEPMSLFYIDTRNPSLTNRIILNIGTCTFVGGTYTTHSTQPAGASCEFTQSIKIAVTDEGSPFVLYFKDANDDRLAVVIKYTIDQTPIVEQLETSLVKINMLSSTNLGKVAIGYKYALKYEVINKSATDAMQLTLTAARNMDLRDGVINFGTCVYDPNTDIMTQDANGSCEVIFNLKMDTGNEGSPFALFYKDANGEPLAVVIHYTIE